jgi:hypothetical protein
MSELRDLLGYTLDLWDVVLLRHHFYGYCKFVSNIFSDQETEVHRLLQPVWDRGGSHERAS